MANTSFHLLNPIVIDVKICAFFLNENLQNVKTTRDRATETLLFFFFVEQIEQVNCRVRCNVWGSPFVTANVYLIIKRV